MRNTMLVAALLLGISLAANAQGASSAPTPSNRVFTQADTLRALHAIFRRGRTWGKVLTAVAPVTIGIVAYCGSQMDIGGYDVLSGSSRDPNSYAYAATLGTPVAITLSLVGPLSWKANSKSNEQETIRKYEQRLPLPKRVQRRLHNQLELALMDTETPSR